MADLISDLAALICLCPHYVLTSL